MWATVGLHPHDAAALDDALLAELEALAGHPRSSPSASAGSTSTATSRREMPRRGPSARRSRWPAAPASPLVVHVREAGDEAMAQLADEAEGLTVVMHCFSLPESVDECNARGYYSSFAGNVTYKNAAPLREAAARVREDRLLVETDAPFLAPVPNRGNSNVPAWVTHTAAVVAEARGWDAGRLAAVTTANARRAFGLPDGG